MMKVCLVGCWWWWWWWWCVLTVFSGFRFWNDGKWLKWVILILSVIQSFSANNHLISATSSNITSKPLPTTTTRQAILHSFQQLNHPTHPITIGFYEHHRYWTYQGGSTDYHETQDRLPSCRNNNSRILKSTISVRQNFKSSSSIISTLLDSKSLLGICYQRMLLLLEWKIIGAFRQLQQDSITTWKEGLKLMRQSTTGIFLIPFGFHHCIFLYSRLPRIRLVRLTSMILPIHACCDGERSKSIHLMDCLRGWRKPIEETENWHNNQPPKQKLAMQPQKPSSKRKNGQTD